MDREQTKQENATAKWKVQKGWRDWLLTTFEPKAMFTLTFDTDKIPNLSVDSSWGLFKKWIHQINRHVIGKNYKRQYKHSYFSYVVTGEYQTRGVIHYHVLVDNYIPFRFANSAWRNIGGRIRKGQSSQNRRFNPLRYQIHHKIGYYAGHLDCEKEIRAS